MFYNVVLVRFKPEATAQQIDLALSRLRALPEAVPPLLKLTMEKNAGVVDGAHDAIIVGEFADVDAYREYQTHPAHAAVAREFLLPILGEMSRIQYEA
ncbi:MAG: hypothetical protein GC203_22455 [Phenylobacterium sp.]|uniref:Dabb family protein n=1 Tax=Phenylobacterium sp. TaxID=1871053 RepID=UPI0025FC7155|nr:Dabb family protein [Phenylobacterium sp.]MBI1200634.1 hypothetical protein [Phenylobacterium sp.]